jgi:signal transduction histidine kinase
MSLRAKVLLLFGAFAVIPLLAIGVIDYVRSVRAVDELVRDQTSLIADRAAREIGERYDAVNANLSLVADNVETRKLLAGNDRGAADEREVSEYFRDLWKAIGSDFQWIAIRDSAKREIYRLGESIFAGNDPEAAASLLQLEIPAYDTAGRSSGSVAAAVKLGPLLPADAMASRFGRSGYTALIDRATGRALYGVGHGEVIVEALRKATGTQSLSFRESDSTRSASFIALETPPWTVVSVASLDEFTAPFASIRSANLLLVLLTTVVAAIAFLVLLWRATRSLKILTLAAADVGRGHLDPALPSASRDEVGRLASAFNLMVGRVRETMAEIERSRQMAVVGEFAAQLAHEIRNPLTSIKLNMQKLERWSKSGRMPDETRQPLEITLREIDRLDRVVHGVLQLGRAPTSNRAATSLARLVSDAVEVARPQLERRSVAIAVPEISNEPEPIVWGDASLLRAAVLNLILNAGDASPSGGTVCVEVERNAKLAHLRVRDSGPGIPADQRDRVFEPFFTTKEGGTGLGLALAQRTVEEHGGAIHIEDGAPGAIFVIDLPLMPVTDASA